MTLDAAAITALTAVPTAVFSEVSGLLIQLAPVLAVVVAVGFGISYLKKVAKGKSA